MKLSQPANGSVVRTGTQTTVVASASDPDGKGLAGQLVLQVRQEGTACAAFDGIELYNGSLANPEQALNDASEVGLPWRRASTPYWKRTA